MFRIKRLYTFIYQTFLPVFAMTFGICLFIFIIQFLWQHIDKLVGKGLETMVIVEFFTYASIMLIPQALPLAILLASLMSFGNMGERLELVAIKASGVSLMKIMKPMIVLISMIAVASFVFQNNVNPRMQVKVYSLLFAMREKSPELEIPEGAFYNDLKGYSIYVKDKDLKSHMLRGVTIYDTSQGFKNMSVHVCDSAIMQVADSKDYLRLTMFDGERFANLRDEPGTKSSSEGGFILYTRDRFERREIVIPFDDEFVRMDESKFDQSQISKNIVQLEVSVDSMRVKLDSLNRLDRATIQGQPFLSNKANSSAQLNKPENQYPDSMAAPRVEKAVEKPHVDVVKVNPMDIDSIFASYALHQQNEIMDIAVSDSRNNQSSQVAFFHVEINKSRLQKDIRMHQIYWHRMFAYSFACLIFFFIGAPLGAIIRKGGLGVPVIISVILFIIYYIIGNIGYKMAREGVWPAWQGEWLSAALLFPLGVFLTYKSMRESDLFNIELYGRYFRSLMQIKSDQSRNATKEPILEEIPAISDLDVTDEDIEAFKGYDNNMLKDIVNNYREYKYGIAQQQLALSILKERGTYFFDVRVNNYDSGYSGKLIEYFSKNSLYICIPLYLTSLISLIMSEGLNVDTLVPVASATGLAYLLFYAKSMIYVSDFYKSINKRRKPSKVFVERLLCFVLYPIHYSRLMKRMKRELEKINKIY